MKKKPRTNWDSRETEGVRAYRRRRRDAGVDADTSVDRSQEGLTERLVMADLSSAKSPAVQTQMQEHRFKRTSPSIRDAALRRRKFKNKSGEIAFTEKAARALMRRRKGD